MRARRVPLRVTKEACANAMRDGRTKISRRCLELPRPAVQAFTFAVARTIDRASTNGSPVRWASSADGAGGGGNTTHESHLEEVGRGADGAVGDRRRVRRRRR